MDAHAPALLAPQYEPHSPWAGQFLTDFLAALRSRAIAHCMLRNYEHFPQPRSGTSDVDLLVDENRWSDVICALRETLLARGLRVLSSYPNASGTLLLVFIAGPEGPAFHLDLLTRLVWRQYDLIDPRFLLEGVLAEPLPPRPHPAHEAGFSLLAYLFHRGTVKAEYRSRIHRLVAAERAEFVRFISRVWSAAEAEALAELVLSSDWDGIVRWKQQAAGSLQRGTWAHSPGLASRRVWVRLRNAAARLRHPPGLWVAVVGPDGCGKTTVGAALGVALASIFPPDKTVHLHWRPGLLPSPRSVLSRPASRPARGSAPIPNPEPHALPPHSVPVSLLRFLYFCIDFWLGVPLRFRPRLCRGGLVLIDRYFYDFHIDQRRYRLRIPGGLVRLAGVLVPRPDLVFYLDAPAEVIERRKAELPADEISRQRRAFLDLVAALGPRARAVNADRPVQEIAAELREQVFDRLTLRERTRAGRRALRGA